MSDWSISSGSDVDAVAAAAAGAQDDGWDVGGLSDASESSSSSRAIAAADAGADALRVRRGGRQVGQIGRAEHRKRLRELRDDVLVVPPPPVVAPAAPVVRPAVGGELAVLLRPDVADDILRGVSF
jgi:hypothetical protein